VGGAPSSEISVSTIIESLRVVGRAKSRRVRKWRSRGTSRSVEGVERLTRLNAVAGLSIIPESILAHVCVCLSCTVDRSGLALRHRRGGTGARRKRGIIIGDNSGIA